MSRLIRFVLPFAALLGLAACNQEGHSAGQSFSAAGNDLGQGFSQGANATGQAITHAAHQVGQAFSQ